MHTTGGSTRGTAPDGADDGPQAWTAGWRARPVLAYAVLAVALLGPLGVAALGTWALAHHVRRPGGGWAFVGWLALVIGVPSIALVLATRAARRLLPVAALLRLSLVFPDRAPRRFSLALRAGTTRRLQQRMREARDAATADGPAGAARRVLELLAALGDHDRLTRGHCERVRALNDLLAAEMGLPAEDRDRLRWAALLHDIGKLRVPRGILTKSSKPTTSEWEHLRQHPSEGALLTAGLRPWLGPWADSIAQHHERWDGAGYPNGLAGTDICLGARIVAVADTFEVMTARRPYQRPVSPDAARQELARCAGSQFDPEVVRAFLNVSIGDLHRALGALSWLAELPFLAGAPHLEGVAAVAGRTVATLGMSTALAAGMGPLSPSATTSEPGATAAAVTATPRAPGPVAQPSPSAAAAPGAGGAPPSGPAPATEAQATDAPTTAAPNGAAPPSPAAAADGPAADGPAADAGLHATGAPGQATAAVPAPAPAVPAVPQAVAGVPTVTVPSTLLPPVTVPAVTSGLVSAPPPAPAAAPAPPPGAPSPSPAPAPSPSQGSGGLLSGLLGAVRKTLGV